MRNNLDQALLQLFEEVLVAVVVKDRIAVRVKRGMRTLACDIYRRVRERLDITGLEIYKGGSVRKVRHDILRLRKRPENRGRDHFRRVGILNERRIQTALSRSQF